MSITLHDRMLSVAKSLHLPELFQSDLEDDKRILELYKGSRFIWLLRTSGSTLVPLGFGADPYHITHWFHSPHGQKIVAFLVNTKELTIEKITFDQAEKFIHAHPVEISSMMSSEALFLNVEKVLTDGIAHGVWGVFEKPDIDTKNWAKWRRYFSDAGNTPMQLFMEKAISCRDKTTTCRARA